LLEAEELKNLKQSYLCRIEEIKREHVIALEPVIARLKVGENAFSRPFSPRYKLISPYSEIESSRKYPSLHFAYQAIF